jgi:hypothetical protein
MLIVCYLLKEMKDFLTYSFIIVFGIGITKEYSIHNYFLKFFGKQIPENKDINDVLYDYFGTIFGVIVIKIWEFL